MMTYVITNHEREDCLARTIEALEGSDVSEWHLVSRPTEGGGSIEKMCETWYAALLQALSTGDDEELFLFLEDDVVVGYYIWHNIMTWPVAKRFNTGLPWMASLYYVSGQYEGFDSIFPAETSFIANPRSSWGSQAYVMNYSGVALCVAFWKKLTSAPDKRICEIMASAGGLPQILHHKPSLVQHIGEVSTWGSGIKHQADSFDPEWKR